MADIFNEDGTYKKTDWKTGDRITEEKLDKIEDALYTINENTRLMEESVNTQLKNIQLDVKEFGAKGDGVSDDTEAIKKCFEYAIEHNLKVSLPTGVYRVVSNEKLVCPRIIGNGSVLDITGSLRFLFNSNIEIRDITIKTNDGGGCGRGDRATNGYLFYPQGSNSIDYAVIENVQIIGNVSGDKRISGGFRINECNNFVKISNVYGRNIGGLVALNGDSNNIVVRDIMGHNIETLVQAAGGRNALYDNLRLINTPTDFDWWIGADLGVGINGKDTILIEGGDGVILTNIYGEYCIERPVYCQASNVKAYNLRSVNTGCFKFVGNADGSKTIKNIQVHDAYLYANTTNLRDSYGQIYGCDDITIDNLTIKCEGSATLNAFFIGGANGEIRINNLKAIGLSSCLFNKTQGITDKLFLTNIELESAENVILDSMLIGKSADKTPVDIIGEIVINNLKTNLENYSARTLIYEHENGSNPLFNKCIINNSEINGTNNGQFCIYGFNRLNNVKINNMINHTKYSITGLSGTSLYANRNITSNNIINENIRKEDHEYKQFMDVVIDKNNRDDDYILNYIQSIEFRVKDVSDFSFELPAKSDHTWKIYVQSKNGGIAEYVMNGNTITEIFKSSEMFNITTYPNTPSANKLNLYVNTDSGFLTVRDRISNDNFYIKVTKNSNV